MRLYSEYLWVLSRNYPKATLVNRRENRGIWNWFRKCLYTTLLGFDQQCYDGLGEKYLDALRLSISLDVKAKLACIWRCMWVEVHEVNFITNNKQISTR